MKLRKTDDVIHASVFLYLQTRKAACPDHPDRQETNAEIAGTLVNTLAPLVLNTLMMVLYLVLMLRQSLLLTAVGISTLLLDVAVSRIISEKRVNITRIEQRDSAMLREKHRGTSRQADALLLRISRKPENGKGSQKSHRVRENRSAAPGRGRNSGS